MEKAEYIEHLKRLQQEQKKALEDTNERIHQWQTFKSDYESLKDRLKTLPDKLSHDVMVPFGKLAFMPGQLVHTNEILVLLGDNWFVERSAKQAAEIVDRRMKTVDKQLEDLFKQRQLLEPRKEFTSELQSMTEGDRGVMDIREDYDEEKEKKWRENHKKNVQRHRRHLEEEKQSKKQTVTGSNQSTITDEELFDRLDQLEQIELERNELQKIGTTANEKQTHPLELPWSEKAVEPGTCSRLQGTSQESHNSHNTQELDSDDDDYDDESNDDERDMEVIGKGKVIHFHHTTNEETPILEASTVTSEENEVEAIAGPSDIYTKFPSCFGPRSILKSKTQPEKQRRKKKRERKVGFEADDSVPAKTETKETSAGSKSEPQQTAFSGLVVEKSSPDTFVPTSVNPVSKDTDGTKISDQADAKPVSRFRAQRLGKNTR